MKLLLLNENENELQLKIMFQSQRYLPPTWRGFIIRRCKAAAAVASISNDFTSLKRNKIKFNFSTLRWFIWFFIFFFTDLHCDCSWFAILFITSFSPSFSCFQDLLIIFMIHKLLDSICILFVLVFFSFISFNFYHHFIFLLLQFFSLSSSNRFVFQLISV